MRDSRAQKGRVSRTARTRPKKDATNGGAKGNISAVAQPENSVDRTPSEKQHDQHTAHANAHEPI